MAGTLSALRGQTGRGAHPAVGESWALVCSLGPGVPRFGTARGGVWGGFPCAEPRRAGLCPRAGGGAAICAPSPRTWPGAGLQAPSGCARGLAHLSLPEPAAFLALGGNRV